MQKSQLPLSAPPFAFRGGSSAKTRYSDPDPLKRWAPKIHPADRVFGEYAEKVMGRPPKMDKELSRAHSMMAFHYATVKETAASRDAKGVNDIPEKSICAIPGYSGFIPRRDAANVLGVTCAKGLRVAYQQRKDLEAQWTEKRTAAMNALGMSASAPSLEAA